jgi:hypothetical protein
LVGSLIETDPHWLVQGVLLDAKAIHLVEDDEDVSTWDAVLVAVSVDMDLSKCLVGEDDGTFVAFERAFRDDHELVSEQRVLFVSVQMSLVVSDADSSSQV